MFSKGRFLMDNAIDLTFPCPPTDWEGGHRERFQREWNTSPRESLAGSTRHRRLSDCDASMKWQYAMPMSMGANLPEETLRKVTVTAPFLSGPDVTVALHGWLLEEDGACLTASRTRPNGESSPTPSNSSPNGLRWSDLTIRRISLSANRLLGVGWPKGDTIDIS